MFIHKIELFKKDDWSVWYRYNGKEAPISELNILSKTLTENIKQTATRLY